LSKCAVKATVAALLDIGGEGSVQLNQQI